MSSSSNKKRTIGEKNLDYRKIFLGVDVKFKLENCKKLIPIGFDNGATTPALKCVFDEVYNNLLIYYIYTHHFFLPNLTYYFL